MKVVCSTSRRARSLSSTINTSSADEAVATEILQMAMIARNSLVLEAQVEEHSLAKLQEEMQEAVNSQLASKSPAVVHQVKRRIPQSHLR